MAVPISAPRPIAGGRGAQVALGQASAGAARDDGVWECRRGRSARAAPVRISPTISTPRTTVATGRPWARGDRPKVRRGSNPCPVAYGRKQQAEAHRDQSAPGEPPTTAARRRGSEKKRCLLGQAEQLFDGNGKKTAP